MTLGDPRSPHAVFSPSAAPAADSCVVSSLTVSVVFCLGKRRATCPGNEALFIGHSPAELPFVPEAFLPSKY